MAVVTAGSGSVEITGPQSLVNVWAVGYMDEHHKLYIGGPPDGRLFYGEYDGSGTVSWTQFDLLQDVCGFGCFDDDMLYAITQMDPMNPGPYYLCTWPLDSQGIPQVPMTVYELGDPFVGTFGGCEWDGDDLWLLDQNFGDDAFATVYRYDVIEHSVTGQWDYGEPGGVGVACVWDSGELHIWVSDWYGGYKIVEHTTSGDPTGAVLNITTNSNDIAFKHTADLEGSGFFVGSHAGSAIVFYPHVLSPLARTSWGAIKGTFR